MWSVLVLSRPWCLLCLLICVLAIKGLQSFRVSSNSLHSSARYSANAKIEPTTDLYQDLKFAILGGGAFSLALSKVLSYKNIHSNLLVRNQSVADHINTFHQHPKYLPESLIPSQVWATSDPSLALQDVDFIVHAVPTQQSRSFLTSVKHLIKPQTPILSVSKGVEQNSCCLMNEVLQEIFGPEQRTAYLSGPSFAQVSLQYASSFHSVNQKY